MQYNKGGRLALIISVSALLVGFLLSQPTYAANQPGANKQVFFVHHSTGQIYWDGTVKKGGLGAELTNHGYTGTAPWWDGNTDPQDFPGLFNDANSWDIFGDSDIIIFKSCYPASAITSDDMLEQYKDWYRELYDIYQAHPNILFMPLSTPPLPKDMTNSDEARRALGFEQWLLGEYKNNYTGNNLAPFGLHTLLSNKNNYLKKKFVADPYDGHPRPKVGPVVGKAMREFLDTLLN
ncbi:MAG: hypothetical protein WCW27_03220 [Patescibacteria group bacterium]|jgi:hypothetical protein